MIAKQLTELPQLSLVLSEVEFHKSLVQDSRILISHHFWEKFALMVDAKSPGRDA